MDEEKFSPTDEIAAFENKLKAGRGLSDSASSSENEDIQFEPGSRSEEVENLNSKSTILMQELVDKENELSGLKESLQLTKIDEDQIGDAKGKKVLELARKNRALQVSLESEKTRSAKAMSEVIRLQEEINQITQSKGWKHAKITSSRNDFRQKFLSLEKTYQALKLKHHSVKEDLKKALKVIQMEVGEYESLSKLATNEGWRGRNQTIEHLRSKVKDLQRQLTSVSRASESGESIQSVPSARVSGGAEERRQEISALKKALEVANSETKGWMDKAQGAISRKTIIEEAIKKERLEFQSKLKSLLSKSDTDDKYIESLKEEVDKLRRAKGMPVKIKTNSEPADAGNQIKILQARIYDLETELTNKDNIIEMFKLGEDELEMEGVEDYRNRLRQLQEELDQVNARNLELQRDRSQTVSEEAKMINELSRDNARLRKKIDDLEQRAKK